MRSRHLHYASGDSSTSPDRDWFPSDIPLFLLLLAVLTATGVGGALLVMVGFV